MKTRSSSKSTLKKPKKTVMKRSSNNAHHAVRSNPFSNATAQPKIPDGLVSRSLSRRLQLTDSVTNATESTLWENDIMHIIMAPTLGVPVMILNTTTGKLKRDNPSLGYPSYYGFNDQVLKTVLTPNGSDLPLLPGTADLWDKEFAYANLDLFDEEPFNRVSVKSDAPPRTVNGKVDLVHKADFSSWRVVSQGMRLELTNDDQTNNGWFEAVRFNWRRDNSDLGLTQLDGTTNPAQAYGVAPTVKLGKYCATMDMVEQPGYTSGLLKDIGKVQFDLHPKSSHHDPVLMDKRIPLRYNSAITRSNEFVDNLAGDPAPYVQPEFDDIKGIKNFKNFEFDTSSVAANQVKDSYVDPNMDWMYIRVHCRNPATSGGGSASSGGPIGTSIGSSFMMNIIQNVEMSFSPESDFATFQTNNTKDPRTGKIADTLNDKPSATSRRTT